MDQKLDNDRLKISRNLVSSKILVPKRQQKQLRTKSITYQKYHSLFWNFQKNFAFDKSQQILQSNLGSPLSNVISVPLLSRVSRARKASIIWMRSNVAGGCLPVAQTTFRKQRAPGRVGSRIAQSKRQSGKIVIAGKRGGKTWPVYYIVEPERSAVHRSWSRRMYVASTRVAWPTNMALRVDYYV